MIISVGPARSDSFGVGVGLSEGEPMAGAVSLRVRGAPFVAAGLEGLLLGVMERSSLAPDDSGIRSSLDVGVGSAIVDTGPVSEVTSTAACWPNWVISTGVDAIDEERTRCDCPASRLDVGIGSLVLSSASAVPWPSAEAIVKFEPLIYRPSPRESIASEGCLITGRLFVDIIAVVVARL